MKNNSLNHKDVVKSICINEDVSFGLKADLITVKNQDFTKQVTN